METLGELRLTAIMILLDVTVKEHRTEIEAKWIHETSGVVNKNGLDKAYERYCRSPATYKSFRDGTLVSEYNEADAAIDVAVRKFQAALKAP